jgi:lipopolysaccharide transport system ATP-binding protein
MEELQNNGTTLIVVSHNLSSIHRLCSRVLLVDHGRAQFLGPTVEGISAYHELLRAPLSNQPDGRSGDADPAEILEFELIGSDERPTLNVSTGEDVTIRIRARFTAPVDGPSFGIWLLSETGQFVYGDNTLGSETGRFEAGSEVVCTVRVRFALPTGTYYIGGGLGYGKDVHERVRVPDKAFHVVGRPFVRGVADLEATFDVDPQGRGISSTATDTPTTASDPRGL